MTKKNKAPVFIVGSPRSGNNFLYHTLLSAGGFAVYRAAAQVFNIFIPRFGNLSNAGNRRRLIRTWLASLYFERTGLEKALIEKRLLENCRSGGDFLRIVMEEMCRMQGVPRWATVGVEEILYLPEIKREIPDALFIHIIRDGRDVTMSLDRKDFIRPFPWDRGQARRWMAAALYWDWIVRKGREYGRNMGPDYYELRYEDLVLKPQETLKEIGGFIGHDLDYERIKREGVGTVVEPNTSFRPDRAGSDFSPMGRWTKEFSGERLALLEGLIGPLLTELGYPLGSKGPANHHATLRTVRALYHGAFNLRLFAKSKTPLGRVFVSTRTLRNHAAFVGSTP